MSERPVEILLVEGNPKDVELTLHALKRNHITNRVQVVRDGAETLEFLFCTGPYADRPIHETPRVILLNPKLPKAGGLEVLRKVKGDARTKAIPVVVLTSSREERDVEESYRLGANSYVIKPVDVEQFTEAVRQMGLYWLLLNEPPRLQLDRSAPRQDASTMPTPVRVLILEDNPSDAELMVHELRRAGLAPDWTRADTEAAFVAALEGAPEVILADHSLPGFDALRALNHLRDRALDIPCIVITGRLEDALAEEYIKQGVCDYLLKDRLARLGGAVRSALLFRELKRSEEELRAALREVKRLSGLLPICASCKKIRDDQGYWQQVEVYVRDHSDAEFTHGICPECTAQLYLEMHGGEAKD